MVGPLYKDRILPAVGDLVLPGLVEKAFPRHIPERSLLTELDRESLNALAAGLGCGELPLQGDRPLEERYLFRIALGSARSAVRGVETTGFPAARYSNVLSGIAPSVTRMCWNGIKHTSKA